MTTSEPASATDDARQLSRRSIWIALLAFGASITSVANGFAIDDRPVIELNPAVHSLAPWWRLFAEGYWPVRAEAGLYRPVVMLGFALQWALGHGAPVVFHIVSILLYVGCAILVFRLAQRLTHQTAAFAAGAVFAVHPVHVEAVGNVVGQSELIAAVAVLGAALLYIRALEAGQARPPRMSWTQIALIALLYATGTFAKESAIVLPSLLVIAHVHVRRRNGRPWREDLPAVRPLYLVLVAVALAALWTRGAALGDTSVAPNTALDGLTLAQRTTTMLGVCVDWLRLFVWPVRLIPVYSPPYVHIARTVDAHVLAGLLILAIVVALAIVARRDRETHAITLGIEWMAIALAPVSNIVIATGIIVAERTLFLPSVGFALVVGVSVEWIALRTRARSWTPALRIAGWMIVAAGLMRSAVHQRVWSDDGHVITAAIQAAPDSYMLDAMYGEYALRNGNAGAAEQWFKRAIELYPDDPSTHISLGELYASAKRFDLALDAFSTGMRMDSTNADARAGLIESLDRLGRYSEARVLARGGIAQGGADVSAFRELLTLTDSLARARHATDK